MCNGRVVKATGRGGKSLALLHRLFLELQVIFRLCNYLILNLLTRRPYNGINLDSIVFQHIQDFPMLISLNTIWPRQFPSVYCFDQLCGDQCGMACLHRK